LGKDEFTKSELVNARKIAARNVVFSVLGPFGTAIDESFYGIGERIREDRIRNYIEQLEPRLKRIEKFKLSKEYLKSEEFYNLNIAVISSVSRTSDKKKLKTISKLFESALDPKSKWEKDIKNIFFKIINEFSINHFIVFRFLTTKQDQFKIKSFEELHEGFIEFIGNKKIDKYQFRLYCREIEYSSLIRFSSNLDEIDGEGGFVENEDSSKISSVILTSMGEKFIEILE